MPTPFMHMALAERLITDPVLPAGVRDLLVSNWGAFLLGSIAPDARVSSGIDRVGTHFFEYVPHIDPSAVQVMMMRHPELAGIPFFEGVWGEQATKNLALHLLLSHMDQRDRQLLPANQYDDLASATPARWLPF